MGNNMNFRLIIYSSQLQVTGLYLFYKERVVRNYVPVPQYLRNATKKWNNPNNV